MRDSIFCRQLIDSEWYQKTFKPDWRFTRDQNAKGLYKNTKGGFRQAIGSGAKTTGDRANGLFMDDMLDAAEGESKVAREEFSKWYDNAFANRVSDMSRSIRCIIGQRLHEADPVGHLMKPPSDWELLCIPQEYELAKKNPNDTDSEFVTRPPTSIGWSDPRREIGELMDPVRFPRVELEKEKRRLGTRGYAAQHQQRPAPAEGAILKRAWFKWYRTPKGADGNPLPPNLIVKALGITRVIQGVDTALSEKKAADYTADCTGGESVNRIYVLDLFKDKVEAPVAKSSIVSIQAKWNAAAVVIEGGGSASGKAAAQTIRSETRIPVIEIPALVDKVVAMNAIAPTVEAGVIYLPEDAPWVNDFVESLIQFPAAEHDDDADAFRIMVWYSIFGGGGMGLLEHMRRQAEAKKQGVAEAEVKTAPDSPRGGPVTAPATSVRKM